MASDFAPHRYTYLAADVVTGVISDEIMFSEVTYSRELNGIGGFEGTVSIAPTTVSHLTGTVIPNRVTLANLQPGRTIIWVLRDNIPMWGGIIWAFDANLESRTVRFSGRDFLSYYQHRLINTTQTFSSSTHDQFTIAENIITYAQSIGGGNIGTTVSYSALSGRKRDRTYWSYEHYPVYDAIKMLAEVNDGFDFSIDYDGNQAALTHTLRLSYPRRGTDPGLVFDTARNVSLTSWTQDADEMANTVVAIGSGQGDDTLQTTASDTSTVGTTYPLLERTTSYKDVIITQTIVDHAAQDLKMYKVPVESVTLQLLRPDDAEGGLGSFITGDTLRVVANDNFVTIDQSMRVMGYTVNIDENGSENISIRLASLEGTV